MAKKKAAKQRKKSHSWRMCPQGQHWVSDHSLRVLVSEKNPSGITIRDAHCHGNSSKKDQIYPDEIHKISEKYFGRVKQNEAFDPNLNICAGIR